MEQAVQTAVRGPARPRSAAAHVALTPDDDALRRGIEQRLGLPVGLERGSRGGRVVIAFHDDQDLDALYARRWGSARWLYSCSSDRSRSAAPPSPTRATSRSPLCGRPRRLGCCRRPCWWSTICATSAATPSPASAPSRCGSGSATPASCSC